MRENPGFRMGREGRRLQTQKQQREAAGKRVHPRRLARAIAKDMGAGKEWREAVMSLPRKGEKYLHPERRRKENEHGRQQREDCPEGD